MKDIFTKSENFKQEYSATIVKVGELKDIENSDNGFYTVKIDSENDVDEDKEEFINL